MRIGLRKNNNDASGTNAGPTITPASLGSSMQPFIDWIKTYTSLSPKNVFEIGANMAQDAEALREGFGIKPKNVWVFEPHPDLFRFIKDNFEFNTFDLAILDKNEDITINAIDFSKNSNSGISSVRKHKRVPQSDFKEIPVKARRMDSFMREYSINSIDFLKLDVEGCNFEVLEGFGEYMKSVKSIHIEAEHQENWEGEKLWEDIRKKLEKDFELVYFQRYFTQSDSFWVQREYLGKV